MPCFSAHQALRTANGTGLLSRSCTTPTRPARHIRGLGCVKRCLMPPRVGKPSIPLLLSVPRSSSDWAPPAFDLPAELRARLRSGPAAPGLILCCSPAGAWTSTCKLRVGPAGDSDFERLGLVWSELETRSPSWGLGVRVGDSGNQPGPACAKQKGVDLQHTTAPIAACEHRAAFTSPVRALHLQ